MKQIKELIKPFLRKSIPDVRPGDTVKIYQRVKDDSKKKGEAKDKIQTFEGIVIAKKHGTELGSTITVRKVIGGVGVERIIPIHLPSIDKIEVLRRSKTRRAKLYFLRTAKGKRARLKRKEFVQAVAEEPEKEVVSEEPEVKPEEGEEKAPEKMEPAEVVAEKKEENNSQEEQSEDKAS